MTIILFFLLEAILFYENTWLSACFVADFGKMLIIVENVIITKIVHELI